MGASNHDSVVQQLRAAGLIFPYLKITGKAVRCKVEGEREKRGWYILHELMLDGGDLVIVGSFGIWRGNDKGAQKVTLERNALTDEQQAALRQRLKDDQKRAEQERRAEANRAAEQADRVWRRLSVTGDCDYLERKGVKAHGVKFTPSGAMAVPMMDVSGRVWGLQFILTRAKHAKRIARTERDKEYWPAGLDKIGKFHLLGGVPTWCVLLAEGYATAASLHEATGLPVAVTFDAGNLLPVARVLRKRYPGINILICADDDAFGKCQGCKAPVKTGRLDDLCPACGKPHRRENTGCRDAATAALTVEGKWIKPEFPDDMQRWEQFCERGTKITDFNDLHAACGLTTVRSQVEDAIRRFNWAAPAAARDSDTRGGGAATADLRPVESVETLLDRFSLVYGHGGSVFDHQEHILVTLSDMRDLCTRREFSRRWQEHPSRKIVRVEEVGFDPGEEDPAIKCNLWSGWPTVPKAGKCENLLDLLQYMCQADPKAEELYQWVLRWIAYPIQHPGAKMKTTVVIHGPQGTGKNMFFEAVMAIYGRYGWVIDQSAIEDKFNDWASRKLFLIADEVVARSEMFHIKNKLKSFITNDQIRINPKNMQAYWEANHVNMVFLSNERMPVVLEEDDRRHAVIWTPVKLGPDFYSAVKAEIQAGGIAALHDHLLNLPMGNFAAHTLPPMTEAKAELIDLSRDSTSRFLMHWTAGEIGGVGLMPALSEDVYQLYVAWCHRNGIGRGAPLNKLIDALVKKHRCGHKRKRHMVGATTKQSTFIFPPGVDEEPPGSSQQVFFSDCIEAFRNALNDYKQGLSRVGF